MGKQPRYNANITDVQLAYLAGIIDGEGCFFIGRFRQSPTSDKYGWHAMIKVSNCDEGLILWLEQNVGGSKDSRYRWTSKQKFTRPVYNWQATGIMLDFLLPLIRPYLVIKTLHCDTMLEYRKTSLAYTNQRLSPEIEELRFEIMKKLRNLNSRFHDHPLKEQNNLPLVAG